jgi:hypothetical protein
MLRVLMICAASNNSAFALFERDVNLVGEFTFGETAADA